ncbi:MAG TPA: M3 family metallopeptidase [Oscillatoriaceae cyanobacterium]
MAVTLDSLSPAAQAEATSLGLRNPLRENPDALGFERWFAIVEENFRAVSAAECRAMFERYQGHDAGDLDRFRECFAAYCYDDTIARICRAHLEALEGTLHRRVELFLNTHLLQFQVAGNPEVAEKANPLENRFLKFRAQVGDRSFSFSQLNQIVKSSPERAERELAWKALVPFGAENRAEMLELITTRNRLARELGYRDFVDMRWRTSEIDETWMLGVLDRLDEETREPYARACDELRRTLGVERLEPWDVSYAVERLCPLPPEYFDHQGAQQRLERLLRGWGFDEAQMRIPIAYSESMGIGGICFGIEPGTEVAILLSPSSGPRYYRTYFHEYGHAMHFKHAGQGNMLLNVEDMAMNEGMALFFESFVSDPLWVSHNLELEEADQERYCRQGRFALLTWMRALLLNIRLEYLLYTHPERDPDTYYLELQQRCCGFELPAAMATRWAGDQFLVSLPVYWHNYVLAELIARQTRAAIQARDGVLLDNPGVGEFLFEHYYKPGAAVPWLRKIELATGRPLDGEAFFRYFQHL